MNILDNGNKKLMPVLPHIVKEKIGEDTVKLRFIGGGSFGRVFKAELADGQAIAIKAYRIQGSQDVEAQQLALLAANTDVAMPRVLFTYTDEETAILAMSFIKGQNVLNPSFLLKSAEKKKAFAEAVVAGMLQWHGVCGEKFGALSAPAYDSWYDYYKTEKQQPWLEAFKKLADNGKLSLKKLNVLYEATELFEKMHCEDSPPVLIHGDLNIMNIMADPKTLKLQGFIDPCGSMWAHREYDLFQLRNMWGDSFGLYETYKRMHPLTDGADFRVAYYAAMHETSMRLSGGLIMPLWEDLDFLHLKKEMKKLKE